MDDMEQRIAALPEWPKGGVPVHGSLGAVIALEHQAALDRLALAREWIAHAHSDECSRMQESECDCDWAEVLAALEGPK
jgi:hypothetical protein